MPLRRPRPVSAAFLVALTCAFVALADNATHFRHAARIFEGQPLSWLRLELAVFGLFLAVMMLFTQRWLVKPALVALLIGAAGAAHLTDAYGLAFNRQTIGDMLSVSPAEIRLLLSWGFARDMLLFGLLPAALVILTPLRAENPLGKLFRALIIAVASFGLCVAMLLSDYSRFAAVFREYPELMARWVPGAPVAGVVSYAHLALTSSNRDLQAVGRDARPGPWLSQPGQPVLAVVVLGSTSRAASWQLGGYGRPTTPGLMTRGVTWFSDVTACGTSGTVSVPCLLSDLPRSGFSRPEAMSRENLPDVLKTAGFILRWWDNNTSVPQLGARVSYRDLSIPGILPEDAAPCDRGNCDDRVLLNELRRELPGIQDNTVILMHSMGSTGPAYHLRYDPATAPFAPACATGKLGDCTHEQILNSYDNSIAFTDQLLSGMIDLLAGAQNVAPLLIYVSDHGESLGENGLWLHSAPWFMAPREQTHVPMLTWIPPATAARLGLPDDCLARQAGQPLSHDNFFATLLGVLDVRSTSLGEAARPGGAMDLTAGCRAAPAG